MNNHDAIMTKLEWERIHPMREGSDVESLISSFEKLVSAELPVDYRSFLAKYGGVSIRGSQVPLSEPCAGSKEVSVEQFFGFKARKPNGSLRAWDIEYEWDVFTNCGSSKLLPIATGNSGDAMCISLVGDDRGTIYFWDRSHLELGRDGFTKMVQLLRQHGIDPGNLEQDQIVYEAEKIAPGPRNQPPGYGNLYLVAGSFDSFLEILRPAPRYDESGN